MKETVLNESNRVITYFNPGSPRKHLGAGASKLRMKRGEELADRKCVQRP